MFKSLREMNFSRKGAKHAKRFESAAVFIY